MNQRKPEEYSFSFLAGALYVPESIAVAALMRVHREWDVVSRLAANENVLRQRKAASRKRILREIRYRLEQLTPAELAFFCDAAPQDQRQLLFLAVCGRFRFIREFVEEVLRPKARALEHELYRGDFARFFDRKAAEFPEIERLTDKSRAKIVQVMVRMLAEAGLLESTVTQRIQRPIPSKALLHLLAKTDRNRLRWLLLSDTETRQLVS